MLRQYSSHDIPSCLESTIEHRINSFHCSNITKPSYIILNDDAPSKSKKDEIKMLDAMNEELNNNNIAVVDSVQEAESDMVNDFDDMKIDALEEVDMEVLRNLFNGSIT